MREDPEKITYFAQTDSRNRKVPFGIKAKDRSRHTYVIGKTGMGKSTLLENMAIQDIQSGNGLAFIDPHGKTAEMLLDYVPEHRIKDVFYFAPFDMEHPISFNVLEDVDPDKRHLVANGLMSTFEKIWVDAWSARMAYILNNTILALLEYPDASLLGINRMLADKDYRKRVVENVKDPGVRSFWVDEFAKYSDRYAADATPAIQNKVGQFTSNPLIRNIVGQPKSSFNMRKMMDEKKIVIINLSKGLVGEGNANLLGSMLITKIYLSAMSRADTREVDLLLPNFYLYVDEFQSFANKSFADILSEARKYKLNLTIAHQYIEQMEEEVRSAVFGNVGTMITFRVGAYDAEVLEKEFAPEFIAEDLVNLGFVQIYLKLMIDGISSKPFSAVTLPPIEKPSKTFTDIILESSRSTFGRPRSEVESEIRNWHREGKSILPDKLKDRNEDKSKDNKDRKTQNQEPHLSPDSKHKPFAAVFSKTIGQNQDFQKSEPSRVPNQSHNHSHNQNHNNNHNHNHNHNQNHHQSHSQNDKHAISPVRPDNANKVKDFDKKPVSLNYLRGNTEKQSHAKEPRKEHLNDLRKALSNVLKDNNQSGNVEKKDNSKQVQKNTSESEERNTNVDNKRIEHAGNSNHNEKENRQEKRTERKEEPKDRPKEIPEDVLRNTLSIDK